MSKSKENYPLILTVEHIAEILAVSKPTAYELMNEIDFPLIRIGRCKRVQRDEFFQWLSRHSNSSFKTRKHTSNDR
ncbi:DNA-binding protein [Bacillaceae bacterium SAOS 7]|nr:DNA-binding protein [Bacillaceae bacterium SAOS 7]